MFVHIFLIVKTDFTSGVSLADLMKADRDHPSLEDYRSKFDTVFVDHTGFVNLLYAINDYDIEMVSIC